MKLIDSLDPRLIIAELAATTKTGVLEEISELLSTRLGQANGSPSKAHILEVLLERERLGSTGIGHGVALPHGRLPGLSRLLLGLGRSPAGVEFDSADGRPVNLFFLLLSPEGSTRHLLALAALANVLREGGVRERLLSAASAQDMYEELLRALGGA